MGEGDLGHRPSLAGKTLVEPCRGESRCTAPTGTELGLGNPVFHKFSGDVG
jgi:hypothetical protein